MSAAAGNGLSLGAWGALVTSAGSTPTEPQGTFSEAAGVITATYTNAGDAGVSRYLEYRERTDPESAWTQVGPAASLAIGETLTTPTLTANTVYEVRLVDEITTFRSSGSMDVIKTAVGGALSTFQGYVFDTDVHAVFLNTSEFAVEVTYTVQATGASKTIKAEQHLDPSGEMNELLCQFDISSDPTDGIPSPAHGDTLTDPNGDVWRVERYDDLQFGMVSLACRMLKE